MRLTYTVMLTLYFGGQLNWDRQPEGWLGKRLFRLWLLYKGKQYAGRRERILFNLAMPRAKKAQGKLLREEFVKRDYVLSNLPKDDCWKGSLLTVPFGYTGGVDGERDKTVEREGSDC